MDVRESLFRFWQMRRAKSDCGFLAVICGTLCTVVCFDCTSQLISYIDTHDQFFDGQNSVIIIITPFANAEEAFSNVFNIGNYSNFEFIANRKFGFVFVRMT